MLTSSFIKYQFPAIVWCGVIFFLSSLQGNEVPGLKYNTDKLAHAVVYFILGAAFHRALKFQKNPSLVSFSLLLTVLGTFLYGMSDEFHQSFVPGRMAGWNDVLADVAGGILYVVFYMRYKFYEQK